MNREQFEGNWHQFKGKIKEKWGKFTDDEITRMNGKYEQFVGALQKKYGYSKEQAEKETNAWNYGNRSEGRSEKGEEQGEGFKREEQYGNGPKQQGNGPKQQGQGFKREEQYPKQHGNGPKQQGNGPKEHSSGPGCSSCKGKQDKDKFKDNDQRDKKRKAG